MRRPAVLWTAATVAAITLAIPGVILYAENPGVATYQLNGLLVVPLLLLVLYWLHRLLSLRLQWVAAWILAPLGGIAYLVWPNEQWWAYGPLTAIPLILLALMRYERQTEAQDGVEEPWYGGWGDGPWGPP